MDKVYTAVALRLISKMHRLGETKIIESLGFILALMKKCKSEGGAYSTLMLSAPLELDSSKVVILSDVCTLETSSIESLIDDICSIPNLDYAKLFELILRAAVPLKSDSKGVFYQPKELTYFVSELIQDRDVRTLYNPFAGIASYQLANSELKSYSQEVNYDTWLIGKIRLFLNDIPNNLKCTDSVEDWTGNSHKFDVIVATPPFRLFNRSSINNDNLRFKHRELESWFIEKSINSISLDGIVISVVPISFLTRSNSKNFRAYLLKEHYIQMIVELPKNLFPTTSIATSLVVLSRKPNDSVIMIDAKSFCKEERRLNVLLYQELLTEISKPTSQYVKSVSGVEIERNEYYLTPSLYLMEPITVPNGFKLLKIKELTSMFQGNSVRSGIYRLIKPFDLRTDRYSFIQIHEELNEVEIKNPAIILDRDLLLLSMIGKLRVNYFHYSSNFCVACSKLGILPLQVHTDIITPEYLIGELNKDYVLKQLEIYSAGFIMPNTRTILEVEILVPLSMDDQNKIFEADRRQFQESKIKELGLEIDLLKVSKSIEFERNMNLRKHALGQILNGFMPTFTLLNDHRLKNNGKLSNDDVVASRTGDTVEDYFNKLELYSLKLEKLVEALIDGNTYGEAKALDIVRFLEKYKAEHPTQDYELDLLYDNFDHLMEEDDEEQLVPMIQMSEKDLTQVLDNIISNAIKHGFKDPRREDYTIRIELSQIIATDREKQDMYAILISNNGEPLSRGMDKSKLFHWGAGSGTGLGAWEVKNIVEHFGGMIKLSEYPNNPSGFEVEYELAFPKTIIYNL